MIRPLSSEFSILLSDVKSQLAGRTKTSHGPRMGADEAEPEWTDERFEISIHGPRVGADEKNTILREGFNISIHGPRVGADRRRRRDLHQLCQFQSTAPVWGPTGAGHGRRRAGCISIHGPRVGADGKAVRPALIPSNFNPRPPCGGRHKAGETNRSLAEFQPTAPVWGPTDDLNDRGLRSKISIHGPRVGADRPHTRGPWRKSYFNPRPPCGGRPKKDAVLRKTLNISIHGPPCGGRQVRDIIAQGRAKISIHGPRVGADQMVSAPLALLPNFNPRPPCGGRQYSKF